MSQKILQKIPFFARLDDQTKRELELLAREQDRSQAGVVRFLIHQATKQLKTAKQLEGLVEQSKNG